MEDTNLTLLQYLISNEKPGEALSDDEQNELSRLKKIMSAAEIKYPPIEFSVTKIDVEKMREDGHIGDEGAIKWQSVSQDRARDPLVKLLLAFLWKQGDLCKIKHIIHGIENTVNGDKGDVEEANSGPVLYQFGRYLSGDKLEPIIDQHVIRAYSILNEHINVDSKSSGLIKKYKKWLYSSFPDAAQDRMQLYKIDKALFTIGKFSKPKKQKQSLANQSK